MSSWFSKLGEKATRTDLWVIYISIIFFMCINPWGECPDNPFLSDLIWAMIIDLGITRFSGINLFNKKK